MNVTDLTARQFIRAMRALAKATGRYVVLCRSNGSNVFATFDEYLTAEDYLATLPVARDCEFKYIEHLHFFK